uniref:Si:ch211-168d1.3 n=1 Tax=Tetraodon nigroviridis TaxID=99883 RepID=H3CDD0_TETNG
FLVRKCSSSQRKVLCLRATADKSASSVQECFISEEDSTFALESSALSFPDLCRLVAFYCISRDVLSLPLQLPDAIARAATHRQLEAISHMGQDFWSVPSASDIQNGLVDLCPAPGRPTSPHPPQNRHGKICFINPLFLQLEVKSKVSGAGRLRGGVRLVKASKNRISPLFFLQQPQNVNHSASNKRNRFKRSMRLRISESSMNLSLEGVGSYSPSGSEDQLGSERLQKDGAGQQRRIHPGAGLLRRTPALSPGSAEEEDVEQTCVNAEPLQPQSGPAEDPGIEVTVQALERRPAPSLAELDSNSSFSSMDEDPDSDSDPETSSGAQSALHRMSEAFVCFFAPDKRLTRLVEELSRDRRSTFGGMVQDFLLAQTASARVTSVQLLQGLRLFLSQAKCCLVDSGELEPPIETLVPENEKDLALERAMFSCVLRPLRGPLSRALAQLHSRDGSTQRLVQNLLRLKGDAAMERLGVRTGVPDSRGVERVKQKLALMQRTHSPIDKVLLLLQVCKCVHKSMGTLHGQDVSWDDFLPSLSYVIVECNRPHILMEVEYMMELLEPSWLGGEGGYYLTCVFASLCLIQKWDGERPPSGCLTQEAQEALKEWSCRRS